MAHSSSVCCPRPRPRKCRPRRSRNSWAARAARPTRRRAITRRRPTTRREARMRLVAGRFKGRVLAAPEGSVTRPTADRVRESLFNILAHGEPELRGARVADVFAGSGALGLEALSRGAAHVTFFESAFPAQAVIAANLKKLGCEKE